MYLGIVYVNIANKVTLCRLVTCVCSKWATVASIQQLFQVNLG